MKNITITHKDLGLLRDLVAHAGRRLLLMGDRVQWPEHCGLVIILAQRGAIALVSISAAGKRVAFGRPAGGAGSGFRAQG